MYRSMCMYKWTFVGTHAHTHVLGSTRDKKYEKKSWDTIFIVMFVYIYFFGYYVVHLLLVLLLFFFFGEANILKIKG